MLEARGLVVERVDAVLKLALAGEDGSALVRISQVVYVRVEDEESRVGFGL